MEKVEISDDIFLYKNFLTKEEALATLNLLKKYAEQNPAFWNPISFYESYSAGYPGEGNPLFAEFGLPDTWFSDIEKRFKEATASVARVPVERMSKIGFHTQKWETGAYAHYHSDNSGNDGTPSAFERSHYATFLYLNDDFEGGLLNFKVNHGEREISIQPEAGMLATFHGGHKNLHEVTIIAKGVRYTIGSFWDDREEEDYPQELRDEWAKELKETREFQKQQQKEWEEVRESGYRLNKRGEKYYFNGDVPNE
jgi:hypothetical protein